MLLAFTAALVVLLGDGSGHRYTLVFETGGQLVTGNEVLVAGQAIGTIDEIDLTDDGRAAVDVTVEEPLRKGTTAVVRSTSLSGVANRYISLNFGPDNADVYEDGAWIEGADTTAPVDLDQLFNVFRKKEREALKKFIAGNAAVYSGRAKQANRAYRFLNPALSTSEALFSELTRDSEVLERFLVEGASTFGAIADRRDDLASLVVDANTALGAVANQNDALDRSLSALPPTLRQANTTFVNLRSALDDLDPLVAASKPATRELAPFLRELRPVSRRAVPVFSDLNDVVGRSGADNDLADTLKLLPEVRDRGANAFPAAIEGMDASQDNLAFLRPYTPDLMAFLSKFGQATAYYDANGHYARVNPAGANVFDYDPGSGRLESIYDEPERQFEAFDFGIFRRCPGGATQSAPDGSNPFTDDGRLSLADCDPSDVPPGS